MRGKGVVSDVGTERLVFGTQALLDEHGIAIPEDARSAAEALRDSGATVSFAGLGNAYAGLWAITDTIKPSARRGDRRAPIDSASASSC